MLLAVGLLGAQAQGTEDLDAKYTKGLLPVGTTAPDFVIKKAKENQPALSLSDYRTHQEGSLQRPGCYVLLDFWATWCPDCRKGGLLEANLPELCYRILRHRKLRIPQ